MGCVGSSLGGTSRSRAVPALAVGTPRVVRDPASRSRRSGGRRHPRVASRSQLGLGQLFFGDPSARRLESAAHVAESTAGTRRQSLRGLVVRARRACVRARGRGVATAGKCEETTPLDLDRRLPWCPSRRRAHGGSQKRKARGHVRRCFWDCCTDAALVGRPRGAPVVASTRAVRTGAIHVGLRWPGGRIHRGGRARGR